MKQKPIIGITLGDPQGIGTEVIVKAITSKEIKKIPLILFGSYSILQKALNKFVNKKYIINIIDKDKISLNKDNVINLVNIEKEKIKICKKSEKKSGKASYDYIIEAIKWANKGLINAVVTAPISKEALKLAGIKYKGHTEIFAKETNTKIYAMSFFSKDLKIILVSTHIPFKEIWKTLTKKRIKDVIILANDILKKYGINKPRLAVAGLNPHAGEEGLMGNEEEKIIKPVVKLMKTRGLLVEGPFPPDTIFLRALNGEFDMVVSLYHDQGLIPVKIINFKSCVNLTCGLPFIRTSPSHGTAFDIAWEGKADQKSMIEAIKLAKMLSKKA